jgi:phosphoglycerate dehydrogenase-like enzyme
MRPALLPAALALAVVLPACAGPTPAPDEPGSLRNARVAIDAEGGARPLLFLAASLDDGAIEGLRSTAPNLRVVVPASRAEALALAPEAHGADGRWVSPEFLAAAGQLAWVQSPSAGVERYLRQDALREDPDLVLTNMQGVHGRAIADHVFALLLALSRDLRMHLDPANAGQWNRGGSGELEPFALHGRTLLVVGLGGIGSEVARRGDGFGMRVWATRRSDTPPPDYVDRQGRSDELLAMLPEVDVVVLCVPLTEETAGLIDAEAFAAMKPGAVLINIARGGVVDTDALVAALEDGTLAGAGLDVTDPEPLPAGHPLWGMPNVVVTPHVASRAALTSAQWQALYVENLRRFAAGEPLLNVVDKASGY